MEDERQWVIEATLDVEASREQGDIVTEIRRVGRLEDLR